QQRAYRASGGRSVQRLHLRGRQDLAAHQGSRRSEQLRAEHAESPGRRAAGETSGVFCHAPPLPSRRLRDLEVRRADSAGCVAEQELRIRNLGRRVPRRVRAPGEIVAQEHWCSSGFANTDLDLQLKKHGIHQLIVIGLIAHTYIEATVRYAAELGYEVTAVKDATADYSDEMMHAALNINMPNYAS